MQQPYEKSFTLLHARHVHVWQKNRVTIRKTDQASAAEMQTILRPEQVLLALWREMKRRAGGVAALRQPGLPRAVLRDLSEGTTLGLFSEDITHTGATHDTAALAVPRLCLEKSDPTLPLGKIYLAVGVVPVIEGRRRSTTSAGDCYNPAVVVPHNPVLRRWNDLERARIRAR